MADFETLDSPILVSRKICITKNPVISTTFNFQLKSILNLYATFVYKQTICLCLGVAILQVVKFEVCMMGLVTSTPIAIPVLGIFQAQIMPRRKGKTQ